MKTKTAFEIGIDRLYHYQSINKPERLARIFTDGSIYFSRPRDFNDPWDCRPCFSKSELDDPVEYERIVCSFLERNTSLSDIENKENGKKLRKDRKFLESKIDQFTSDMDSAIQTKYRVYCLTTHPDSTLMWSHYADSCKGICLEFSVNNNLFCGVFKIEYCEKYPLFRIRTDDEDENIRTLLTKSKDWEYEDEFRVMATEKPYRYDDVPTTTNGFLALPKGALQSVIIGAQMPLEDQELVQSLVKKSGWNVELKVASLVPDRYAFEIRHLD